MDISSLTPNKQVKLQYWLDVIRQCRASELMNQAWCEQHNISLKSLAEKREFQRFFKEKYFTKNIPFPEWNLDNFLLLCGSIYCFRNLAGFFA